MKGNDDGLKRTALSLFVALAVGFIAWFFVKYALFAVVPVVISAAVAALLRPAATLFSKRTRIPYRVCGGAVSVVTIFVVGFLSVIVTAKLVGELGGFLGGLVSGLEKEDNVLRRVIDLFVNLRERIPIFDKLGSAVGEDAAARIYSAVTDLIRNAAQALSAKTAALAGSLVSALPGALFASTVTVAGTYYLTTDREGVKNGFFELLPPGVRRSLSRMRGGMRGGLSGYLRAYLAIMVVTFCELFVGFIVLGFRYSFLIAAAVAIVDILPVLGSGTVLFPWATVLFLIGDFKRAIGLLVLLGIMSVVRQIIEPKLLGKYMGHHPFVSLFSAYLGFTLLGVPGLIAAPAAIFVLKYLFSKNEKKPVTKYP
ncbi:MAG: sporulation integral membrane protein YtvI [Clostridia bacterium]|nr:sporulation integral membrane protein YtvI [Clostridia bacterium]